MGVCILEIIQNKLINSINFAQFIHLALSDRNHNEKCSPFSKLALANNFTPNFLDEIGNI